MNGALLPYNMLIGLLRRRNSKRPAAYRRAVDPQYSNPPRPPCLRRAMDRALGGVIRHCSTDARVIPRLYGGLGALQYVRLDGVRVYRG